MRVMHPHSEGRGSYEPLRDQEAWVTTQQLGRRDTYTPRDAPFPRIAQQNPIPRVMCIVIVISKMWKREKPWWW